MHFYWRWSWCRLGITGNWANSDISLVTLKPTVVIFPNREVFNFKMIPFKTYYMTSDYFKMSFLLNQCSVRLRCFASMFCHQGKQLKYITRGPSRHFFGWDWGTPAIFRQNPNVYRKFLWLPNLSIKHAWMCNMRCSTCNMHVHILAIQIVEETRHILEDANPILNKFCNKTNWKLEDILIHFMEGLLKQSDDANQHQERLWAIKISHWKNLKLK